MRWSWPAFGAGVAVGAILCLGLLAREGGLPADSRPETVGAAPSTAGAPEPRPSPAPRARSDGLRSRAAAAGAPAGDAAAATAGPVESSASGVATRSGGVVVDDEGRRLDVDGAGRWSIQVPTLRVDGELVALVDVGNVMWDPDVASAPVAQGLVRAKSAADALAESGASTLDVDAMLASDDDSTREAGIGLALRAVPPMLDRLLRAALDADAPGSLRATALLAASEAAPRGDRGFAEAVVKLASDANVDVRRVAVSLLERAGAAGADRAVAMLREGDWSEDLLDPLARAVAASDRALDFLLGPSDAAAAFAVLRAVATTQPGSLAARQRLLDRLPDAVRPLLGAPEMTIRAGETFPLVAAAGHAAFLRGVAVATNLPTSVRLAAVDAAANAPACAAGLPSLLAAALSDAQSPVEFLRAVLVRAPREARADGGVKAAIEALATHHPNAWLREEARAALQASPPPATEPGSLRIVSGVYGKDGSTVDVTAALRAMVVGGRLVVEAGNALAGDPLVGTVKDLAVTYEWRGQRRTRTIREYETLTLP